MKILRFLTILLVLNSCSFSSTEQIEEIKKPDLAIITNFGITIPNEVEYQFYQKYGFTDVVEHLVLIVKGNPKITEPATLVKLNDLELINTGKFNDGKAIGFNLKSELQGDVLIGGKHFESDKSHEVIYSKGQTLAFKSESRETVIVHDEATGLVYVESIIIQ